MTFNDEHDGKGGSYLADPKTGKRTLVERTDYKPTEKTPPKSVLKQDGAGETEQTK